jgi:hypothetical protein
MACSSVFANTKESQPLKSRNPFFFLMFRQKRVFGPCQVPTS